MCLIMAQLEEVKKILRSLLVSAPVKVTVSSLNRDYKSLEGYNIPHRELGYNSLLHLLHSIPDVLRVNGSSFESEVTLVINQKVAHVCDMVMKQKMPSKGRNAKIGRKSVIREPLMKTSPIGIIQKTSAETNSDRINSNQNMNNNQFGVRNTRLPDVTALSPFPRPVLLGDKKIPSFCKPRQSNELHKESSFYNNPIQMINNVHNSQEDGTSSSSSHFIKESGPLTKSTNCDRVPSLSKHMPQQGQEEDDRTIGSLGCQSRFEKLKNRRLRNKYEVANYGELKTNELSLSFGIDMPGNDRILSFEYETNKVPLEIQQRLLELIKLYPSGIQCSELPSLYKKRFFKNINYQIYGFDRLISLCMYLENIFHWEEESDCDFRLYDKDNPPLKKQMIKDLSNEISKLKVSPKTVDLSQISATKSRDWDKYADLIPQDSLKLGEIVVYNSLDEYKIGDTVKVVISEIYNPVKFWIYMNDGHLNEMMNCMQDFYKEHKTMYLIPEFLLDVGLYCVVRTLNEFQRALIVDLLHEIGGYVKVYLIDYGTLTNLPRERIWFLMKKFSVLPAQAVETGLAGIEPKDEGIWTEQSILRFKYMVTSKQIFAKILDKKEEKLNVNISVMSMPLKTLNDLMVQEGYANYLSDYKLQVASDNLKASGGESNPRKKFIERIRLRNQMKQ